MLTDRCRFCQNPGFHIDQEFKLFQLSALVRAPALKVNEYQIGNRCSPLRGAFWSIIHDADLRDLCRGGETHADIVLKLAALRLPP